MKNLTLLSLILVSMLYSAETKDIKYTDAQIAEMSPEEKMIYMPDIITPDSKKSGIYAGMGLAVSSLSSGSTSIFSQKAGNNRMVDFSILAGYNINEYLSAETRAMLSVAYDDNIDFKSWGFYLKPQYEVYKDLKLYSLIGYGKNKAKSIGTTSTKASSGSAQVGVGADYKLGNNFKLFADYTYLGSDSGAKLNNKPAKLKASAITTGITYDF